ncbi:cobalamin B12-binding domain-containing protein [Thetidibacter halocola]|uniref:Cobalamin B12-binding domain-containing protein n=1 Tax=Thetidibacter halocola TaxID=2827239 RepID=A0A8J7WDJ7_9RHOB|nr:cobalamin B12-binding domain-containing protein [Thetidibacter halocola]MBS0123371.1 cobalamin B12-binding domain-containing protein [Thetidibacter halocola]
MIDMPIPLRAIDSDAHGQARPGLPEAALVILAQEVILRLARWAAETAPQRKIIVPPRVEPDIDSLCAALTGLESMAASRHIMAAHREGATHEELCLYHIGAAATRLGELWEEDRISLRDMALAAGRMLNLLRDLRALAPPFEPRGSRCALFATVPGETHVLGVTMAADIFRDHGWDVDLRLERSERELSEIVRKGAYPIVGLSASSVERVRALARVILELRIVAPKILIFVSGYIAKLEPDIAIRVGADGAAWKMDDCEAEMERLHAMLPGIMVRG